MAKKYKKEYRKINLFDSRKIYGQTYQKALTENLIADDYHPNKIGITLKSQKIVKQFLDNTSRPFD